MAYYPNHNVYNEFKKLKDGKVESAVLKNLCNWSKRIHKPIFVVARRDHVIHQEGANSKLCASQYVSLQVAYNQDYDVNNELEEEKHEKIGSAMLKDKSEWSKSNQKVGL